MNPGTPASHLAVVGHTQDCPAHTFVAVIPTPFWTQGIPFLPFLMGKKASRHPSWADGSQPPAPLHDVKIIAELSSWNGTSATFIQLNTCPDRDYTERTRPVTPPPVPYSHGLLSILSIFVSLELHRTFTTHPLRTSVTMLSSSGAHRRPSPNGRHRHSLWTSSNTFASNSS